MTIDVVSAPVGRSKEYRRLVELIDPERSALLVIAGPPGSGRTDLVRHLRDAATKLNYHCIGVDEQLVVERVTRLSDVLRVLKSLSGQEITEKDSSFKRTGESLWRWVTDLWDAVVDNAQVEKDVLIQLAASAPLLLTVDGYRPSVGFDNWVTNRLVPWFRKDSIPIVLIIVGTVVEVETLRENADAYVSLGDLDVTEVREFLEASAVDLRPALTAAEIDIYSAAASRQPQLVDAFRRVIAALVREGAGGTP